MHSSLNERLPYGSDHLAKLHQIYDDPANKDTLYIAGKRTIAEKEQLQTNGSNSEHIVGPQVVEQSVKYIICISDVLPHEVLLNDSRGLART